MEAAGERRDGDGRPAVGESFDVLGHSQGEAGEGDREHTRRLEERTGEVEGTVGTRPWERT